MPDIDFQKIELNLIPKKGDEPVVFYASQYETARPFIAVLKWGDTEFAPSVDSHAEIDIRKNDDNLVVITDDVSIDNNEVSVILPVQAVTCIGKNLGQVKIYAADDQLVAALNFILEVQADPLAGGVTSETAIDNLTQQIADIVPTVIGDDYYNKAQTDALLNNKVDASVLNANYYTKSVTDALLADKADRSELPDMDNYYDKTYIDDRFSIYRSWASTQLYLESHYYDKLQVDDLLFGLMPVGSASGNPCIFDTEIAAALQSLTANIVCGGGGGTPSIPIPLVGHSELNLTRCGKNLFDVSDGNGNAMRGVTPAYDNDGGLTFSGTVSEVGWCGSWNIDITLPAGTYTFSISNPEIDHNITFALDWSAKVVIDRNTASKTVTFSQSQRLNRITLNSNSDDVGQNININVKNFQIEIGSTATAYEPYNGQPFTVAFGQTVYGGVYDANRGKVKPNVYYPSYNGETINGRWLSSKDVYVEGNIPTTGSQVVCLDEYDTEIDVSELSVSAIVGTNNIVSDCGGDVNVSYKDTIQHYIDQRVQ